jgi:serine/threonine protein kinase
MVGSKIYMAPEIIRGEPHGIPCDIWSMGIILYTMLSQDYPFSFRNIDDEILNAPVLYLNEKWNGISPEARNLISMLLNKQDSTRITAKQALDHPWFKKF